MTQIDPTPEDILRWQKEENETSELTTEALVYKYGIPKVLADDDLKVLNKYGLLMNIFCAISNDLDPTGPDCGMSGYHFVNVVERFVFPNKLPPDLFVSYIDYGILYGNEHKEMEETNVKA